MRQSIIAIAVSTALTMSVNSFAEDSGPTLYGRINLAVEVNDDDSLDSTTLDLFDVVSRFGIKGEEDLSNGLSAIYHYEFRVNADQGGLISAATGRTQRLSYVGLNGNFGELTLGAQWSTFSNFVGTNLDPTYTLGYFGYSTYSGGDYRIEESVKYSGNFGPVSVGASIQLDGNNQADDSIDRWQVGVSYSLNSLVFAVAYDTEENTTTDSGGESTATGNSTDISGASITYFGDGFKLNVGYINTENDDENLDRDWYSANITYSFTQSLDVYGQYFTGDGIGDDDQDGFVAGVYYSLSPRTKIYFEGATVEFDNTVDSDVNRYLFGMRHDF